MRILDKQPEGGWRSREGGEAEGLRVPGHCVFTHDIDGPFLDTEQVLDDVEAQSDFGIVPTHGYIHVNYVEQLGKAVGMRPKSEFDALKERVERAELELTQLRALAEAVEAQHEAEDNLLKAAA